MTSIKKYSLLLLASGLLLFASCKKDDKPAPPTVATLTTTAVTNITTTTATSGGTISSNGGADITASGVCYSKINATPTIADDTTKGTVSSGSFVSNLKNLDPGSTYYVRAYAINSAGTGYGSVVTFSTGNAAPEARSITITGDKAVAAVLTAIYVYFDFENNPESGTTIQWYVANDSIGAAITPIAGATAATYTLTDAEKDRFIIVGITPKASAGASPGTEAKSYWVGAIGGEVVTFTYNGASVTYGVITSSVTGRKWMDRNLGAKQAATGMQDHLGYGDLFQWGRLADGHQLMNWTQDIGGDGNTPVNGNTTTISTGDVPGNNLFILSTNAVNSVDFPDWRNPQKPTLWQAPDFVNNPCPAGWHVPTMSEWDAESITTAEILGENHLKLTTNSQRRSNTGIINGDSPGHSGYYWTESYFLNGTYAGIFYYFSHYESGGEEWGVSLNPMSTANACRCIKN